ncbi:hypothetical protein KCP70_03315 [Salmonella enterica subsp. enterica]|nr:hypothetical protein KCP70_03315 [Salmonella enterica subsp. enterica]
MEGLILTRREVSVKSVVCGGGGNEHDLLSWQRCSHLMATMRGRSFLAVGVLMS